MLNAALRYAERNIPVFPCGPRAKTPLTTHGFKDATTDFNRITEWWTESPNANIAMPTGAITGRLVVDIDPRHGGDEALESLIDQNGRWDDTAEQITGGGGLHIFFQHPAGIHVPKTLAPGIDLKGDGGYVLLAPSVHPNGNPYVFDGIAGAKALLHPAPVPAWMLAIFASNRNGTRTATDSPDEKWPKGKRNESLTSLAGTMRRRGMSRESIEAALLEENRRRCNPPLPDDEVKRIAASVGQYKPAEKQRGQAPPDDDTDSASATDDSATPPRILSVDQVRPLRQFAAQNLDFVVEGFLCAGTLTAVTGESGSGKTTFVSAICDAVSQGSPFAGLATSKRQVLMLDRENPLPVVVERSDRLGIVDSPHLKVWGGWEIDEPAGPNSAIIRDWVACCEPKPVLVFDSLVAFQEGDENSANDVRRCFQGFRALANLGATVIVIHHSGKAESSKDYRGSSDIKGAIDVGYHVANLGDPSRLGMLRLRAFKARFAVQPEAVFTYHDGVFRLDGRAASQTNAELLQDLLVSNPGVKKADFEKLGIEKGVSRSRLRSFIDGGILARVIRVETGDRNCKFLTWVGPQEGNNEELL